MASAELVERLASAASSVCMQDVDIREEGAQGAYDALCSLLADCDVFEGEDDLVVTIYDKTYTMGLLDLWISFAQRYGVPGGSRADYTSSAVISAIGHDWTIRLTSQERADELYTAIEESALNPERWCAKMREFQIIDDAGNLILH